MSAAPCVLGSPKGQCQSTEIKAASRSALSQTSSGLRNGQGRVESWRDIHPFLISCSVPSTAVLKPQPGSYLVSLISVMLLVNSEPTLPQRRVMGCSRKRNHTKQR